MDKPNTTGDDKLGCHYTCFPICMQMSCDKPKSKHGDLNR